MLEIKNLTKIYRSRGGVTTKALDNVSIKFAETGLVFLLGKSGSGKSTLLNVAGGLDEPTEGEVIVKGKSSLDFTGSDFDSYRNTFVGFIFQEYNILDEFNVEDNVALALELQGKPKDRQRINAILRDVELENLAKRKPNTLSGGQKQRIAIARALVKEPQIIMADEPTGALDSATGKQVFDVLKKLSETRLVIVVSHDREFAEIYGDRIVELSDGKIISDVTKSQVPPEKLDENVHIIGNNTLSIKSGAALTEKNFAEIQSFIQKADGDVIITRGGREIESFKKANRLSGDGAAETFFDTAEVETREYTPEQSKFIRSKLPVSKAIRIGASGLKLKPVRLVFTIFLAMIAFIMFGISSTVMMYDGNEVMVNSFVAGGKDYLPVGKVSETRILDDDGEVLYSTETARRFSDTEIAEFNKNYGTAFGYWQGQATLQNVSIDDLNVATGYYYQNIRKFAYLDGDTRSKIRITGSYPEAFDEICISSYTFDVIKNNSLYMTSYDEYGNSSSKKIEIKSEQDIIGKYLYARETDRPMKVTGVFDAGEIPEKYKALLVNKETDHMLSYNFSSYLESGLHLTALIASEFKTKFAEFFRDDYLEIPNAFDEIVVPGVSNYQVKYADQWGFNRELFTSNKLRVYGGEGQLKTYFYGEEKQKLAEDEIVLGFDAVERSEFFDEALEDYYNRNKPEGADEDYVYEKVNEFNNNIYKYVYGGYYDYSGEGDLEYIECTMSARLEALENVVELLSALEPRTVTFSIDEDYELKVVGFYVYDNPDILNYVKSGAYVSQEFCDKAGIGFSRYVDTNESRYETNYVASSDEVYDGAIISYDGTAGTIRNLLKSVGAENKLENDAYLVLNSSIYNSVMTASIAVDIMSLVFLIVGLVLAIFASLLLFNFISVSISNKRKEIGILRAVGARGIDVFKIFFAESGIIVGICTVLALIGTAVLCTVLNGVIMRDLSIMVTFFVFGIGPVAVLVGAAVLVAVISTFLPVYLAARKKPVDSIRAL